MISKVLKTLWEKGANLSITDRYGRSPLYMGVAHKYNKDIFDFLVSEAKVNLNQRDLGGNTVLDRARLNLDDKYPETVLVEKGAEGKNDSLSFK